MLLYKQILNIKELSTTNILRLVDKIKNSVLNIMNTTNQNDDILKSEIYKL